MPIDPNILLQQQPVASPLSQIAQANQVKNVIAQRQLTQSQVAGAQQEQQMRQTAMQQQQQVVAALQQNKGDLPSTIQQLNAAGNPQGLVLQQHQTEAQEAIGKLQETQQKIQSDKADHAGRLADSVLNTKPELQAIAYQGALQIGQQAGYIQPGQLPATWSPEAQQALSQIRDNSISVKDKMAQAAAAKTAQAKEDTAAVAKEKADAELPGMQAAAVINQQKALGTVPMTAQQRAEAAYHDRENSLRAAQIGVERTREGRENQKFQMTYGQGLNDSGQSIVGTLAKQVSDLDAPPPSNRSALYGPVMQAVNTQRKAEGKDPYDLTQWQNKVNTSKDFSTGGKSGQQAMALNTLVRHSDDLMQLIPQLNNGGFTPANAAYNKLKQVTGQADINNFNQLKQYVVGETVKLVRGSGGSEEDVKAARGPLDAANSPKQLQGAMQTNFEVAGGKMQSLNSAARKNGLGDNYNVLDPGAQQIVQKHGYDPNTLQKTAPAPGASGSGLAIKAPNGKTYHFKSQADLDTFKKEAGL